MKRYYACVNEGCDYKTGPYRQDYDESVADPNSHWACMKCPFETYTDENGNVVHRRPRLKPAHVYNQREQAAMKRAERVAMGLPPGGVPFKPPRASSFGAGILDVED